MDPKLLVTIGWMALVGAALIALALEMLGRMSPLAGLAVIAPLCMGLAWLSYRSRRK